MGKTLARKMVIFMIAAAMVLSSGIGVFAASSSEVGAVSNVESLQKVGSNSTTITWNATDGASGYIVYKNGNQVAKVTDTSYVLTGVQAGEMYTISVAAIAKDGTTVGAQSAIQDKTLTMRWMKTVKVKKVKKGKKKFKVTWKKVKGATGYQILYSKDGVTWQSKFVKGGKKTKATIKKLSKGKWFVKVRPVKGNYLGALSGTKKVKVK